MAAGRATVAPIPLTELLKVPHSEEDLIRQRAYDIYLSRNGHPGSELDDWLEAEAEIRQLELN
jgi:hypothetical protein